MCVRERVGGKGFSRENTHMARPMCRQTMALQQNRLWGLDRQVLLGSVSGNSGTGHSFNQETGCRAGPATSSNVPAANTYQLTQHTDLYRTHPRDKDSSQKVLSRLGSLSYKTSRWTWGYY